MAKYNIGGYIFNDEESAKKAAKELRSVEYILGQLKTADEKAVLQIYRKLIKQRLFSTEIGMGFLNQLRQNLVGTEELAGEDIPEVYSLDKLEDNNPPVEQSVTEPKKEEKVKKSDKPKKEPKVKTPKVKEPKVKPDKGSDNYQIRKLKIINSILIVISVALFLSILGMFYINSTIDSPTILNYEETITDQYSTWKQELDQREADLNERERALELRESGQ